MKTANKIIKQKATLNNNHVTNIETRDNDENQDVINKLLANAFDYQENNQLEQANFLYQEVLQKEPKNICALNGLGLVALNAGMLVLASEFLNTAHLLDPRHMTVNCNLGLVYTKLSEYKKAIKHYRYLLEKDKSNGEIHGEIARLYQQIEHNEAALNHYQLAFMINPSDPRNFSGMVQLDAKSISLEYINSVEKHLLEPNLPLQARCSFYFSLGAVYDASESYDQAFANYAVANISKVADFDADKHANYISEIIQTFSEDFFKQQQTIGLNESNQPIFIVGMPESGIVSIGKSLSQHNEIYSAGELDLIEEVSSSANITSGRDINAEQLADLSKAYLNHVNAMAINDNCKIPRRIIDIKPSNFLHLGLISLLFPKAKIIHCVANPFDICLSNYFKNYSSDNKYAYDQKNIAMYYQQYERLMAHWHKALAIDIHTINYDEMVMSPELIISKLYDFINLPQHTDGAGQTDNIKIGCNAKVNQALCNTPARHWQHYRKYSHAMLTELMLLNTTDSSKKAENLQ